LQMGVFSEFSLPGPSTFPLTLQLLVGTRFSPAGIKKVRQATKGSKSSVYNNTNPVMTSVYRNIKKHPGLAKKALGADRVQI